MGCLGMSYPKRKELRSLNTKNKCRIVRLYPKYDLALVTYHNIAIISLLDYKTLKIVYSKSFDTFFTIKDKFPHSFNITMERGELMRKVYFNIVSKDKITDEEKLGKKKDFEDDISPLEYFDDGTFLLSGGDDKNLKLVKENNINSPLKESITPRPINESVCKNNKYVVLSSYNEKKNGSNVYDGSIYFELWDIKELKKLKEVNVQEDYPIYNGIFFDEKTCIIALGGRILIFDLDSFTITKDVKLTPGVFLRSPHQFHILDNNTFLVTLSYKSALLYKMKIDGTIEEVSESSPNYDKEYLIGGFFINDGKEILYYNDRGYNVSIFSTVISQDPK